MRFRTEYKPERAPFTLTPERPVVFLGSCFADNMSGRMRRGLWDARKFSGTLYNPVSIQKALEMALFADKPQERFAEHLFDDGPICHSWLHDSSFSRRRSEIVDNYMETVRDFRETMKNAQALFITFGTSICYILSGSNDYIVGNCHKQPASLFTRRRLSVEEIVSLWTALERAIHLEYPDLHLIFTVSPVRHIKDGFAGNARSKAVLQLAVEQICESCPDCHYFPAYEIMNDDLRDYRFYDSDLLHPSDEAAEYIWEIFKATYLDEEGMRLFAKGENILKALRHRPLIADAESREAYISKVRKQADAFLASHPGMRIPE